MPDTENNNKPQKRIKFFEGVRFFIDYTDEEFRCHIMGEELALAMQRQQLEAMLKPKPKKQAELAKKDNGLTERLL